MKKTLLAAALVTGFAGVAQAESSVQLYGIVDAGLGYTSASFKAGSTSVKATTTGARSGVASGNRWGLKGQEDLGNGTYAIFQLESGFNLADGNSQQGGRLFGRRAIIGLKGDSWGTFSIGRQNNAADEFMGDYDPFGAGFGQAANVSVFGASTGARDDASLKYLSPDLSGFKLGTSLASTSSKLTANGNSVKTNTHTFSLGLSYTTGGFSAGASFTHQGASRTTSVRAWNLGLSYDFDVAKVFAMYGQQKNGFVYGDMGILGTDVNGNTLNAFSQKGLKTQAWLLGVTAPVSENGKVMFSYQGGRIKNSSSGNGRIATQVYNLGYDHKLSKRTDVYTYFSYGKATVKGSGLASKPRLKVTNFAVGLRHKF